MGIREARMFDFMVILMIGHEMKKKKKTFEEDYMQWNNGTMYWDLTFTRLSWQTIAAKWSLFFSFGGISSYI